MKRITHGLSALPATLKPSMSMSALPLQKSLRVEVAPVELAVVVSG